MIFNLATAEIQVKKEILIYDGLSFISELGGAAGLFLGFSFLGLWDIVDWILTKTQKIFRNTLK